MSWLTWRSWSGGRSGWAEATPPTPASWTAENPTQHWPPTPDGRGRQGTGDGELQLDGCRAQALVSPTQNPGHLALVSWTGAPTVLVAPAHPAPGASRLRSLPEPVKYPKQRTHNKAYGAPPGGAAPSAVSSYRPPMQVGISKNNKRTTRPLAPRHGTPHDRNQQGLVGQSDELITER
jgi:hypothetical protein